MTIKRLQEFVDPGLEMAGSGRLLSLLGIALLLEVGDGEDPLAFLVEKEK
jgi:hypothetical protein